MQTFISDISGNTFPVSERVSGRVVRNGVLKEILKANPRFHKDCSLSVNELNQYRRQYIQNLLSKEVGTLTELEQKVLDNIQHNHIIADEASDIKQEQLTKAQRWADKIASFGGSWRFITSFGIFIIIWMFLNVYAMHNNGYDPYPFILLNLILSCIAALQAPVIMMSQNRQEEKDRERSKNDYMVNLKSELEIRMLHEKTDHLIVILQDNLMQMQQIQIDMMQQIMEKLDQQDKTQSGNSNKVISDKT